MVGFTLLGAVSLFSVSQVLMAQIITPNGDIPEGFQVGFATVSDFGLRIHH